MHAVGPGGCTARLRIATFRAKLTLLSSLCTCKAGAATTAGCVWQPALRQVGSRNCFVPFLALPRGKFRESLSVCGRNHYLYALSVTDYILCDVQCGLLQVVCIGVASLCSAFSTFIFYLGSAPPNLSNNQSNGFQTFGGRRPAAAEKKSLGTLFCVLYFGVETHLLWK